MHTDKAIAEFEAWWDRQPHREQFEDVKDQMRNVWLASRRELVVELNDISMSQYASVSSFRAAEAMRKEDRAAIEAAGGTVRG
ncbi:hypothetical protein ACQKC8_12580 [Stutzerimonas stutzeri]|uniref:hypothetical protein n=1 Tax=Stutzerimonas stutzeri TaxID=316 RepID=UPI003C2D57D4